MMPGRSDEDLAGAVKRAVASAPLIKRFYTEATVRKEAGGFAVLLDGKPVRTPGRKVLAVPRREVAEALAAEWLAQGETINPATMPVTRLVNSAIDGVAGNERAVAADIGKYAGSDLVCYRADWPEALVAAQTKTWDPVLEWAKATHGWRFVQSVGVVHVEQPEASLRGVEAAITGFDAFALAGLHTMTTLTGSVLLALAVAQGRLDAVAAWKAAHLDEDFQISQWGEDTEARTRRAARWAEMVAAALLVRA
jgi:chaperone required for assembly of F1-ATPase